MRIRQRNRYDRGGSSVRHSPEEAKRNARAGAPRASEENRGFAEESAEEYLSDREAMKDLRGLARTSKGLAALIRLSSGQMTPVAKFVMWAQEDSGDEWVEVEALGGVLRMQFVGGTDEPLILETDEGTVHVTLAPKEK